MGLRDYLFHEEPGITLYCGDCRDVLPLLDTEVAAVVTDPPYNVGFPYLSHDDRMEPEEYLRWLSERFTLAAEALEPAGALVWFWQGIRVANGEARAVLPDGFVVHHLGAWFKREFAGDLWKGGHPAFSWEPIIWAARASQEVTFYGPRGGHAGRDCLVGNDARHDRVPVHRCPKPSGIVRGVVQWVTRPGGAVLDPFAGSGTTLLAAKELGHPAIGIEIEPRYCEIAVERLRQGVLL